MEPLVTLAELRTRLDWTLEVEEEGMALAALDDASNIVRAYGLNWTRANAPALAKTVVAKATARYLRNPEGYSISRAGEEHVEWGRVEGSEPGVFLTQAEQKMIANLARPSGIYTAPVFAWNGNKELKAEQQGYVPTQHGSKFPYYSLDDSPWW